MRAATFHVSGGNGRTLSVPCAPRYHTKKPAVDKKTTTDKKSSTFPKHQEGEGQTPVSGNRCDTQPAGDGDGGRTTRPGASRQEDVPQNQRSSVPRDKPITQTCVIL